MTERRSCSLFLGLRLDVSIKVSLRIASKQLFMRATDSEMLLLTLFLAFFLLRVYLL